MPQTRNWIAGMLLAFVVAPWTSAFAAERVALVIGNGAYEHAPRLGNSNNDAKDIRDALVKLGFKVEQTLLDKPKEELIRGLKEFRTAAEAAQIAVVFYAGHGIEVAGVNYLVPVDAELRSDGHVEYEAVSLELVTNAAAGARSFGLVVLDACRDNPFARKMRRAGATRSIGRGLGRVEPTGGGMVVAYAAKAGTTADDGDGRNSPYTAALLRHLRDAELVGEILNKVAASFFEATGGRQEPVAYGRLPMGAYFTEPAAVPRKPTDQPPDFVREWWLQIKDTAQPRQLEAFIEANPEDRNARLARVRLKELWATAPAGTVIRDFLGSGGRGPEMVVIPAGRFRMGCLSNDDACFNAEQPVHDVTISAPFALSAHEVTFEDYDRFTHPNEADDEGWGRGARPVINVSWDDAKDYVEWLSSETGATYRLPSEAEWEYAARAGTGTKYSGGMKSARTGRIATTIIVATSGSPPRRSVRSRRTNSAYMTCTATCGSGWRTAGTAATRARLRMAARGAAEIARCAFCAAAAGSAARGPSAPQTGSGSPPTSAKSAAGSVWPGRSPLECLRPYVLGVPWGACPPWSVVGTR